MAMAFSLDRSVGSDTRRLYALCALVFAQMLCATMLAPAIRPLFALHHGGDEGAMHAFMAVNMVGAIAGGLAVGRLLARGASPRRCITILALADAALLAAIAMPLSTPLVLVLRTVEGAAHVGAATALLSVAAGSPDRSRAMGLAGGAIILAVAAGSAIGALLLWAHPCAPFAAGAALAAGVAVMASRASMLEVRAQPMQLPRVFPSALAVPIGAAFVARFAIGCLVVTFALFAHGVHGLSDAQVGGLYALFTYPFALLVYPAARCARKIGTRPMFAAGAVVYAAALGALPIVPTWALPPAMVAAGVGSAALFAAILTHASAGSPSQRATAMGWINAAGALGMLLGPTAAGIGSAILRSRIGADDAHRWMLALAAISVALWAAISVRWLARRGEPQGQTALDSALECP